MLSVLYLNRFLKAWRQQKKAEEFRARIVLYADDFVILSRGRAAQALAWTQRVMERIGLTLNDAKTSIRDATTERFDFLGYSFGPDRSPRTGGRYLSATPSATSIRHVKQRVKEVLAAGVVEPWDQVCTRVNQVLIGWGQYFSYGTKTRAYRAVDWYVHEQVRNFLQRRHNVQTRGTRCFSWTMIHGELGVISLVHRTKEASPV